MVVALEGNFEGEFERRLVVGVERQGETERERERERERDAWTRKRRWRRIILIPS